CPADDEAEQVIRTRLLAAFPRWGFLGEETGVTKGDGIHVWVVDPNDGTRAMQRGFRGNAVSIALVRHQVPVLGVVLAVTAPGDEGDLFEWAEGCGPLRRNGEPVPARSWPSSWSSHDVVAVSHEADHRPTGNARAVAPARFLPIPGIAYRLALVAAGEITAAVSVNNPAGVDYAAGHALLRAPDGAFVGVDGKPIHYEPSGNSSCGGRCFGGPPDLLPTLVKTDWDPVRRGDFGDSPPDPGCEPARLAPGHRIAHSEVLARAQGCLLGQLAGDALGSLVEFQRPERIARRYPDGGPRELADGGTWSTIAGQPTDDSELALALARTLLREGPDPDAIASSYGRWYRSHPFDCGHTTRQALRAIGRHNATGSPSDQAATAASRSSQANGSLMRISPLGIWGWKTDPDRLAELARRDSALTHPHEHCREAAALFTVTLAAAIRDGLDPASTYAFAEGWAREGGVPGPVVDRLEQARTRPPSPRDPAGWVLVALQHAFHALATAD
ncbi:MAG: ADP-ribosylglycohydrolase family protein, partial [Candidatus Dormibacteraeota bacterium]|nr:ADP-ribosylglycohydrolase family protein [Candidatus Dormibacteraeota bacterium]